VPPATLRLRHEHCHVCECHELTVSAQSIRNTIADTIIGTFIAMVGGRMNEVRQGHIDCQGFIARPCDDTGVIQWNALVAV